MVNGRRSPVGVSVGAGPEEGGPGIRGKEDMLNSIREGWSKDVFLVNCFMMLMLQ